MGQQQHTCEAAQEQHSFKAPWHTTMSDNIFIQTFVFQLFLELITWQKQLSLLLKYYGIPFTLMFALPVWPSSGNHIFNWSEHKHQTTNVCSDADLCREPWTATFSNKPLACTSNVTSTSRQCLNLQRLECQQWQGFCNQSQCHCNYFTRKTGARKCYKVSKSSSLQLWGRCRKDKVSSFHWTSSRCLFLYLMTEWQRGIEMWSPISILGKTAPIKPHKELKGHRPTRKTWFSDLFVCVGDESNRVWSTQISGPQPHAAFYPAWRQRNTHTWRSAHLKAIKGGKVSIPPPQDLASD